MNRQFCVFAQTRCDLARVGRFQFYAEWSSSLVDDVGDDVDDEGDKSHTNNAITDGGVAPPPLLLTIVMMSSNLKNLRISRNSKDSIEGQDRIVGSAQSAFAQSAFAPAALRPILIINLKKLKLPLTATDGHKLPQTATDCH